MYTFSNHLITPGTLGSVSFLTVFGLRLLCAIISTEQKFMRLKYVIAVYYKHDVQ